MNRIIFVLTGLLIFCQAYSQDIIYKNDGTEISSTVTEITSEFIKYKNFSQPDGPIRNIPIKDVFMIIYKDGTREVFKEKSEETKQPPVINSSSETAKGTGQKLTSEGNANTKIPKANSAKPQDEKDGALFLHGGFSPIIGFAGGEYFIKKVGIEAGWGKLTAPISQETNSTIGIGISLYFFNWYKSSPYISIGFCSDGAVYEKGMTIYDTPNNYWVNLNSAFIGYRVAIARIIDLKAGTGYRWSEYTKGFAFEATAGLKIFSNKFRN